MSNFVVSARKYRPVRFEEVVGQEHVGRTLKNALKNDQLAHAFLFCGPRGVGKTTCARILAKVLNCRNATGDYEPCGECDPCRSFAQNASFNITELDAASNNSVEHIRALIEQVRFQPQQGRYKVFIIDEVHMLSQQAFNAFLKTLEEPPPYAIFILATTEKHKIIPTILSRCQIFDFKRIQVPDMVAHLQGICSAENITAEEEALHIIAQKADGALRDALSIFDRIVAFAGRHIRYEDVIENLNVLDYDFFFKTVDAMLVQDVSQVLLVFNDVQNRGFDPDLFINGLAEHLRNLLVCQDEATLELLEGGEKLRERYARQARLTPPSFILTALSLANDCDVNYKMARNKRLHVEMALIKMNYLNQALTIAQGPAPVPEKKTPDLKPASPPAPIKQETASPPPPPAPEKTPDPTPEPAQKTRLKSSATPSLKGGIHALAAEISKAEAAEASAREAAELNLENLKKVWKTYVDASEVEFVRNYLGRVELELSGKTIRVLVGSRLAEDTLRQEGELINHLREHFREPQLVFDIVVDRKAAPAPPKINKPLSDKEKYLKMAETNPLIRELQQRFQLRPDER